MKTNILLLSVLLFAGCANLVGKFDQNSYVAASELKVQSLALMAHGNEPAMGYSEEIADLRAKLSAQLAYEEGKGKQNQLSFIQWSKIADPNGYLLGKFLNQWEGVQQLPIQPMSPQYVQEKTDQIGQAFDEILKLEGGKQ